MIDVLVAEDEFGAREQIKLLVGRFQEFRLVGEADNGDSALELLGSDPDRYPYAWKKRSGSA